MIDCTKFDYDRFIDPETIKSNTELDSMGITGRWIAMDISEAEDEDFCTVSFYLKRPDRGHAVFYIIEDELSMTEEIVDPIPLDPWYSIPKSHSQHPFNVFGETKVLGTMIRTIFTHIDEIIQ